MSVGMMNDRKDRPAYVRFERRALEDRAATVREGKYIAKDVDFALVTAPYSRDVFEQVAHEWLEQMRVESGKGRLPVEWYERYVESYERWKRGQEMPLDGTAIKGWSVISPAQQKNLIGLNILTVEDLAAVNDEGKRRMGLGAQELCDKAKAWLAQAKDKGPLTIENAALKAENRALQTENEHLKLRVRELSERLEILQRGGLIQGQRIERAESPEVIAADDILDDAHEQESVPEAPVKRGPGRPRKNPPPVTA